MQASATPPASPAAAAPTARRRRFVPWLVGALLVLLALLIAGGSALWWVARQERGTAWLLSKLPGVEVVNPRGSLIGDFSADAIVVKFGDGGQARIEQPVWQNMSVGRSAADGAYARIAFDKLHARRVQVTMPKSKEDKPPSAPPRNLKLPVELIIGELRIDEVHAAPLGAEPLRDLTARIHLGAEQGKLHRIDSLAVTRGPLKASGHAHVGAVEPMTTDLKLDLQQSAVADWPAWRADVAMTGPLAEASLAGKLVVESKPEQSVDLDASLRPFAAFPLAQLDAKLASLDISALLAGGPKTSLSGSVVVRGGEAGASLEAQADLVNAEPGTWNAGRVPARRIQLSAAGDPRDPTRAQIRNFEAELGSADRPAGRLSGDGVWSATQGWSASLALHDVRPDRLDERAPSMVLQGSVAASGAAPQSGRQKIDLAGDVTGRLPAGSAPGPIRLQLRGTMAGEAAGAMRVELQQLQATSGASSANAKGVLQRPKAGAPWRADGSVALKEFDLRPWWPGPPDAPLRRTRSRLSAKADFDLTLPAAGPGNTLFAWLSSLQGRADARVTDSLLAGIPLRADASFRGSGTADGLQASVNADAAGNSIDFKGRLAQQPAQDHWEGRIDAPALQRLAALAQLAGGTSSRAAAPAVAGSVQGEFSIDGRWPQLQTRGDLAARGIAWPGIRLQQADARWRLGTDAKAPAEITAKLVNLTLAGSEQAREVPSLAVRMDGTADSHRLEVQADIAAAPPAWVDALQGAQATPAARTATGPRTRAQLRAAGGLVHEPGGGPFAIAGWRGRIESVDIRRAGASQPLVRTANVDLEWRNAAPARPARLAVQPGRIELAGGALRWTRLNWQAGSAGAPAQVDVDATLDPTQVAPLLARFQPSAGWSGDLVLSARAVMRTAPELQADVVVQRLGGDLQMDQGGARRALGLNELRLALKADGTRWNVTGRVAGRWVGVLTANVDARTASPTAWPDASTTMQGKVDLRIQDLGVYDPWLPVGWRLGGNVQANARLGGRLGAPEYSGTVRGSELGVRNFVEGVRVHSGELQASLDGERGRIERFTARAGEGTLNIRGDASFGATPAARIDIVADHFRVLGRVDRQVDVSGRANVSMKDQRLALRGQLTVDEGLIDLGQRDAPQLSKDVRVVDGPTPGAPKEAKPKKDSENPPEVDLRLDLGSNLRVRGKGIDTLLAGELRITAPRGEPEIEGTVRTVKGNYDAYAQKLRIDRGLITFVGPVANPRLDIQAVRPDLRDMEVGVSITGTAQNPRVRLFSNPELSELDKLSWLTMGRSSAGLATDQTALLQRAALALLAGDKGGDGVIKRLGLDSLSVRRGQSGGVSDAVVTVGKQVSERFYVGYQQSLDATGGGLELIYKITRRFQARVQTGQTTAVDLIWTWLRG